MIISKLKKYPKKFFNLISKRKIILFLLGCFFLLFLKIFLWLTKSKIVVKRKKLDNNWEILIDKILNIKELYNRCFALVPYLKQNIPTPEQYKVLYKEIKNQKVIIVSDHLFLPAKIFFLKWNNFIINVSELELKDSYNKICKEFDSFIIEYNQFCENYKIEDSLIITIRKKLGGFINMNHSSIIDILDKLKTVFQQNEFFNIFHEKIQVSSTYNLWRKKMEFEILTQIIKNFLGETNKEIGSLRKKYLDNFQLANEISLKNIKKYIVRFYYLHSKTVSIQNVSELFPIIEIMRKRTIISDQYKGLIGLFKELSIKVNINPEILEILNLLNEEVKKIEHQCIRCVRNARMAIKLTNQKEFHNFVKVIITKFLYSLSDVNNHSINLVQKMFEQYIDNLLISPLSLDTNIKRIFDTIPKELESQKNQKKQDLSNGIPKDPKITIKDFKEERFRNLFLNQFFQL